MSDKPSIDDAFNWAMGINKYKWLASVHKNKQSIASNKPNSKKMANDATQGVQQTTLSDFQEEAKKCTRCILHTNRIKSVFGYGNVKSRLMFIGEAPGEDENRSGLPFIGRAGQVLTGMLGAIGLRREDVYICNTVKCRPPDNRQPTFEEITACSHYLEAQIHQVKPALMVALGLTAARTLLKLNEKVALATLRNSVHTFSSAAHSCNLIITYHPSYLMRRPTEKHKAWQDLKLILSKLSN